ncbi:enoyl-CoA-hydratase DpgB [Xanthomonas translucens]|uniref:enoyl-CoA-hydratase DpgB n=1 Tax=Xanthomonas campestris pv. translucens TaxID=343 RepID=UPI0006422E13|nr:enoyl-CoA-hydratase DpgB [Xanthomonas translucens]AKK67741.1 enoyl-CoA hydratase [Xanthomonas translucens pv. undulosa]MCT8272139.1 enoyl-CoA hydratase [Xanthomonas translucens pv. undulosa]QEN93683.1 enoyl-CoA hydratase [Xanthomonas translucens pv. undulosa]QSQ40445.1 enoyl-CoA hydratase [Xanthomonas translucens pv. translucens]QSQ48358.1 enoyl-CoA hydratase [Xanthomonas translucens pv. undulosa]
MSDPSSPVLHLVHLDIDAASALNDEQIQRLTDACDEVEDAATPAILILHLRGTAKPPAAACWPGAVSLDLVNRWEKAMRRFERLDGLSLAWIENACSAGMLDLLLAVDQRIAAPTASICVHSGEAAWPSMAMRRMSTRLGMGAARAVFLFQTQLCCARMAQLGVVDQVSDDGQGAIVAWLASLAGVDVQVLPSRRLLLLEGAAHSYEQAVGQHLAACDVELRRRQLRALQHAAAECGHDAPAQMVSA